MATVITQTANPAGVSASANVATYSSQSIGPAAPNRIVVVAVASEQASTPIDSCTIDYGSGDTAMTAGSAGNFGAVYARLFYLPVPTGTTATIKVTWGTNSPTSTRNHIAVYSVVGGTYSSAGNDGSTDMDATDPLTTGSITIPTGGAFIAVAGGATDGTGKTWANATEDIDADAGDLRFTTATRATALTTTAVTCTGGTNGEDGALSYIIFTDNTEPTVALSSPADSATGVSTTPDLVFTGTDTDSDDVRYEVQVDTVNTFDSQGSAEDALSLSSNGTLSRSPVSSSFTDISFFCWVKITDNSVSNTIFMDGTSGGYGNGFSFFVDDSGDGNYLSIDVSYIANLASNLAITDNDWHFVGFTRRSSDNEWTIYLDGSSDDVGSTAPYSHDGNALNVIGGWNNEGTPTAEFEGSIARVGFWGSLLTSGNISSLYGGDAVSTIGSPLIDLPLDDSAAWGTNDGSGGNFTENGTLTEDTGGFDYFSGGPLIDAVSGTDSGFSGSPDNTDPFASAQAVDYTVQSDLTASTTYYWRVRAIDPAGSNTYGDWSSTRSFTATAGGGTVVKDIIGGFIPFAR